MEVQLGAQGSNSGHQVAPILGLPAKLLDQNVALLQRGIRVDDVRHGVLDMDAAFHAVIDPLQLRDGRENLVLVEAVSQFNALPFVRAANVQCSAAHHLFITPGHKTKRNQQALCCGIFRHGDAIDDLVTAAWKGQRRTALHQQQPAGVKRQKQIVLCHRLNQSMAKPGKAPGLHRGTSGDGMLKLRPARKPQLCGAWKGKSKRVVHLRQQRAATNRKHEVNIVERHPATVDAILDGREDRALDPLLKLCRSKPLSREKWLQNFTKALGCQHRSVR